MNRHLVAACGLAVLVSACGGGGSDPVMVSNSDTTLAANATVASAVVGTDFKFASGVPSFGTTAATSVSFTGTGTAPAFSIASGAFKATGQTNFGSCIFVVSSSDFPAGHPLALGQTVTVNPCGLSVNSTGVMANGVAIPRHVALVLGAASSGVNSLNISVTAGGELTIGLSNVGRVTLTPTTGAGS